MDSSELQILIFFSPPQVTFFLVLWKMLHLHWLFMSVQSLVSGVLEKSEHFTFFFKFKKLHAFVLGHFECTEFWYSNGNYCSFNRIQIFFMLIPYLLLVYWVSLLWIPGFPHPSSADGVGDTNRPLAPPRSSPGPVQAVSGVDPRRHRCRLEARLGITHLPWSLLVCPCPD